jgi:cytochrome c-type biogenesis protein CcmH
MIWVFIVFTLIVIGFILPSLIAPAKKQIKEVESSLDIRMIQLKRDFQFQTKELKRRLESGDLDEQEWQQLTDELKRDTAQSIAGTEKAAKAGNTNTKPLVFAILTAVVVGVAYMTYQTAGFHNEQQLQADVIKFLKTDPQAIDTIRKNVSANPSQRYLEEYYLALRSRVELDPDNPDVWRDLSFFNANYGRNDEAMATLRVAMRKYPDDLDLKVDKAQLLSATSDTKQIIEGHKLLGEVLKENPNHQGALLVRGDSAYRIGMYDLAIKSWQTLATNMQDNAEMVTALNQRISSAEARLRGDMPDGIEAHSKAMATESKAAPPAPEPDSDSRPGVRVVLEIPGNIMDQLNGNEDIFVFARAVNGPPFPIAARRMKVADFRNEILLDDTTSMQAQFALSNYDEIQINARISLSGGPNASSGDIQGKIASLKRPFPAEPVTIVLSDIVP